MFPKHHPSPLRRHGQKSSALVITLAVLVLVSALLLVFFNQSTLNRQISFSSAGQYRADLAAHTAMDTITGDLRSEMAAGSTIYSSNSISIYIPTTNFTMVPFRVGDQGFANLVKQSSSTSNSWTGIYYDTSILDPKRSAANNSTAAPSLNGRYIRTNQWNEPGLLGDPGSGTTPDVTNTYAVPPDWVLITRQGVVTDATLSPFDPPAMPTLSNSSATNQNYVVGRYAYTMYDEGGLLDVNVAGYPTTVGSDFTSKRGLLPQVDLANIPGIDTDPNANALVQWRNQTTAASATSYTNYVFTATNGFTTVAPGDQAFVGRRDLIKYVQANSGQISTSALQYLGTFTRELNAPSYTPVQQTNPSLINVRVTTSFSKPRVSDGTMPVAGEPLIKYRFPLSYLNWIGYQGPPNGAMAQQIQDYFGLKWQAPPASSTNPGSVWVYVGHSGSTLPSTIATLSQVASAGREPDFFELLQAAIGAGSVGMFMNNLYAQVSTIDANTNYQIMQIGANLIDQYDTDSYPTRIWFNDREIDGVESLPYLMRILDTPYRKDPGTVGGWHEAVIWNPHEQITPTPAVAPTQFRYILTGSATSAVALAIPNQPNTPPGTWTYSTPVSKFTLPPGPGSQGIIFYTKHNAINNTFSTPTLLSVTMGASAAYANDNMPIPNALGIWIGDVPFSNAAGAAAWYGIHPGGGGIGTLGKTLTHNLQYSPDNGSTWITYDKIENIQLQLDTYDDLNFTVSGTQSDYYGISGRFSLFPSDPRTDRFGASASSSPIPTTLYADITDNTTDISSWVSASPTPGWTFANTPNGPNSMYWGTLAQNTSAMPNHYADPDGVLRPGDGGYADGNLADGGYPLAMDSFNPLASRPIVLNRPFASVAEMAYASRGAPWKSLDFFTSTSADAALLDLFCLSPTPAPASGSTTPSPEAGRVNLNSRQAPVLQAVLQGAILAEDDTSPLSSSQAEFLANKLVSLTTSSTLGPLLNRSELVTRWISDSTIKGYSTALADSIIKRRREAAIRALADIGNTRTWNLLIDVIAQSGRYAPTASNLNQFTVEGERRYWLHIAIDRYTGKVIAQSLEAVYE